MEGVLGQIWMLLKSDGPVDHVVVKYYISIVSEHQYK